MQDFGPVEWGDVVRRLRKASGWTQENFGDKVGLAKLNQAVVSRIENGKRDLSDKEKDCLAICFGIDVAEFYRRDPERVKEWEGEARVGGREREAFDLAVKAASKWLVLWGPAGPAAHELDELLYSAAQEADRTNEGWRSGAGKLVIPLPLAVLEARQAERVASEDEQEAELRREREEVDAEVEARAAAADWSHLKGW